MNTRFSTQLQLVLGLILMILIVLFPPQGFVLVIVLSVLGYLGVRVLANVLANRGQFSYNGLSTRFARALSPLRPAPRHAVPPLQEWIEASVSLWLIAWVIIALLLYRALETLTDLYYASLHSAYVLTVDHVYWGVLAMVAGAALALALSQMGMRLVLREHYDDYVRQLDHQLGLHSKRAAGTAIAIGIVSALVFIVPGLVTYTRFSSAGIGTRDLLAFEERMQSYQQVQNIQLISVPSPTRLGSPAAYFEIDYADGTEWTTPHFDSSAIPPLYSDAVNYAATQSGRAVQRVALSDAFTKGASTWPIGIIDEDTAFATRSNVDGKYKWQIQAQNDTTLVQAANMNSVSDFQLNLDCQRIDGPDTALCGAVFRQEGQDYYVFLVGQDQTIRVYLHYHDWITLIPPRQSSAVHPGQVNHITVDATGSHFSFSINHQVVAQADDSTLHSGRAGVGLQLAGGDQATIQFENLMVLEK